MENIEQMQNLSDQLDELSQQQQQAPVIQPQIPSEILELELNYDKSLEALDRKLRGMTLVTEGKQQIWKQTQPPWMNGKGVSRMIGIIKGHVDINTFMSFLQDTEINQISYDIADEVATILSNKCVDFEIEPTYLGTAHSIVVNNIFFALKRAQNALTLKQIHSTTTRVEHPLQAQAARTKERRGFLGRFF